MDFTKFFELLNSKELFFSRPDKFDDVFEGSLTLPTSKYLDTFLIGKSRKQISEFIQSFRNIIGINCWHMNEVESAAMWQLYLKNSLGVAVQSTFDRLSGAFHKADQDVFLSIVNYVDYETYKFKIDHTEKNATFNFYDPFIHKRNSFSHENELRAIVLNNKKPEDKYTGPLVKDIHEKHEVDEGIKIKVDFDQLIENIYIAPNSPQWFKELVSQTIELFGLHFNIKASKLEEIPKF